MLYGIHISPTASSNQLGKNEEKESVEKCQGTISCLENGLNFYMIQTNKQELFEFLSCKVADWNCPANKHVVITSGSSVIIKGSIRSMESCNHEEADYKAHGSFTRCNT